MYDDIGKKIKKLTKIITIILIILSVIVGFFMITDSDRSRRVKGLVMFAIVPFVIWVCSLFSYGFGELVDKTCDIEEHTRTMLANQSTSGEKNDDSASVDEDTVV